MKKCINKRCNRELQDDFIFCPYCGKNQTNSKPKVRRRTKGTGSIYLRKDNKSKPYAAASSVTGKQVYLGAFATKREAENALKDYEYNPVNGFNMTLEQLHDKWVKTKAYDRLGKSVKSNYASAWIKLEPLHKRKFRDLRTSDYQYIIDYYDNPHHEVGADGKLKYLDKNGKGTYKVTNTPKICEGLGYSALHKVKCLLTTLYTFAMKEDIINKDYATFIELPEQEETTATRFTEVQLELIRQSVGKVPYMDYIYIMCYVNFRVSEFLELTPDKYKVTDSDIHYFVGGKKTDAGKDRIVPIHPKIQQLVQKCIENGGETIFCRMHEGSEFGKAMNKDYFLKYCFRPAMQAIGLGDEYTPHSCRRTFSTRMSAAGAREEDIIALMGHTDYKVDIDHYIIQEVDTLYNAIKLLA
ncbi:tyrosine-type recombinase/integrase [uncultured Ruminococcus sp.]|uniref:tyrosine-type recombinase/integrase n=1 Tax=uncultured Ruminococcus sp. TaxID=165186 RepID=UPI0026669829|nr:tyrosine-type recombinase/integrase [uncultured Ruminococcus sp.]